MKITMWSNRKVKSKDPLVREKAATEGHGLDKLVYDEDKGVRLSVAKKVNELMEVLSKDSDWKVRRELAASGYRLSTFISDENELVRKEVASQGYGLATLVNDENFLVRAAVAKQGYGLDKLIHDKDELVRMEVANQGYNLETLVNDESGVVRSIARAKIKN